MLSLRIIFALALTPLAVPAAAMADLVPLSSGPGAQLSQITARRSAAVVSGWNAFLMNAVELPTGAPSDLDPAQPWYGGVGGGGVAEGQLFTIVTEGHDVSFGLDSDVGGSVPAWHVTPGGVRPVGPGVGPGMPSGGSGEVVIVPLPPAAFMGLAVILGLGGATGLRRARIEGRGAAR